MNEARLESLGEGRFRLAGELGFETVPAIWAEANAVFEPFGEIEVDLQAITRADSAAVALLLAWTRRARSRGKVIRFRGVPAAMLTIIELSDLDGLLPLGD